MIEEPPDEDLVREEEEAAAAEAAGIGGRRPEYENEEGDDVDEAERPLIESGEGFVLVDALAPMSYARSHLPGAINLPLEWVDERAPHRVPDLDTEIARLRDALGGARDNR